MDRLCLPVRLRPSLPTLFGLQPTEGDSWRTRRYQELELLLDSRSGRRVSKVSKVVSICLSISYLAVVFKARCEYASYLPVPDRTGCGQQTAGGEERKSDSTLRCDAMPKNFFSEET